MTICSTRIGSNYGIGRVQTVGLPRLFCECFNDTNLVALKGVSCFKCKTQRIIRCVMISYIALSPVRTEPEGEEPAKMSMVAAGVGCVPFLVDRGDLGSSIIPAGTNFLGVMPHFSCSLLATTVVTAFCADFRAYLDQLYCLSCY